MSKESNIEGTSSFVSVVVPMRNEEKHIERCIRSLVNQDYPNDFVEIVVVDGMSNDNSKKIVKSLLNKHSNISLYANPNLFTSFALNIGISKSKGEIIIILGAHSKCPPHFISDSIRYLHKKGVDVVGGPIVTKAFKNTFGAKCVALITSHPFGVGNSKFRTSKKEGFVDTVGFGVYRRGVFEKVGLFDERLIRNQDNELNSRIIKNGGKIYQTPHLTVCYYNQSTIGGLLKQAFRTGMWNVATIKINPAAYRWRHFVPFCFVTALVALGLLCFFVKEARYAFLVFIGLYGMAAAISSLHIGLKEGIKYTWILPSLFFLYHMSYGLGTLGGLFRMILRGGKLEATKWS